MYVYINIYCEIQLCFTIISNKKTRVLLVLRLFLPPCTHSWHSFLDIITKTYKVYQSRLFLTHSVFSGVGSGVGNGAFGRHTCKYCYFS